MLLESLKDENPCMRNFALKHIETEVRGDRAFLSQSDEGLPALLNALDDSEVHLRIVAAECLFMLVDERHVYREQATDVVLQILRTGDPGERRSAVSTLYACAASRKNDAVDALLVALRDEHHGVRYAAAGALRHFRDVPERAEEILVDLRAALRDEDESVRVLVAGSIEALRQ
jgi:HEAT repeat protein